jgi:hypothetical protein
LALRFAARKEMKPEVQALAFGSLIAAVATARPT